MTNKTHRHVFVAHPRQRDKAYCEICGWAIPMSQVANAIAAGATVKIPVNEHWCRIEDCRCYACNRQGRAMLPRMLHSANARPAWAHHDTLIKLELRDAPRALTNLSRCFKVPGFRVSAWPGLIRMDQGLGAHPFHDYGTLAASRLVAIFRRAIFEATKR